MSGLDSVYALAFISDPNPTAISLSLSLSCDSVSVCVSLTNKWFRLNSVSIPTRRWAPLLLLLQVPHNSFPPKKESCGVVSLWYSVQSSLWDLSSPHLYPSSSLHLTTLYYPPFKTTGKSLHFSLYFHNSIYFCSSY